MPDDDVRVPGGLTTEALLGRRYFARFIDSIIILALAVPAIALAIAVLPKSATPLTALMMLPVILVVWIGYGTLLESSKWQATVGKKLLGLRVYNSDGARLTPMQAGARNLLKDGPFLMFGVMPGGQLLAILWLGAHVVVMHRSPVYQAIHDRAAHSLVAAPEETTQLHLA